MAKVDVTKDLTAEEITQIFCEGVQHCSDCPFVKICDPGREGENGFMTYLRKEAEDWAS